MKGWQAVLCGSLILVSACTMGFPNSGRGSLSLTIGHGHARFLSPDFTTGTISGKGPNEASFSQAFDTASSTVVIDNLLVGTWAISVELQDGSETTIQTGSQTVDVEAGENPVSLTLTAPTSNGNPTWLKVSPRESSAYYGVVGDGLGGVWAFGDNPTGFSLDHYDKDGNLLAEKGFSGVADIETGARGPDGSLWLAGLLKGDMTIVTGETTHAEATSGSAVVLHYSATGEPIKVWVLDPDNTTANGYYFWGLATGSDGMIYVAGSAPPNVQVAPGLGFTGGSTSNNGLLVALDSELTPQWAQFSPGSGGAPDYVEYWNIALSQDSIYVSGKKAKVMVFDNVTSTSQNASFLARFDRSGAPSAIRYYPATEAGPLTVLPSGEVASTWYPTGSSTDFGDGVSAAGANIAVVLRSAADLKAVSMIAPPSGLANIRYTGLTQDGQGGLYVWGYGMSTAGEIDFGQGVKAALPIGTAVGSLVVKYDEGDQALWAQGSGSSATVFNGQYVSGHGVINGAGQLTLPGIIFNGNSMTWGTLDPWSWGSLTGTHRRFLIQFR